MLVLQYRCIDCLLVLLEEWIRLVRDVRIYEDTPLKKQKIFDGNRKRRKCSASHFETWPMLCFSFLLNNSLTKDLFRNNCWRNVHLLWKSRSQKSIIWTQSSHQRSVYLKINFNIMLLPVDRSPQWCLPLKFAWAVCFLLIFSVLLHHPNTQIILGEEWKLWCSSLCTPL